MKRKSDMLRLQRDCGVHRANYLKSTFNFLRMFIEQTTSDRDMIGAMVKKQDKISKKLQKKSNTGRENYGKLFVSSKPHDSDDDEDDWDSAIEASSNIDATTDATGDADADADADAMTVD